MKMTRKTGLVAGLLSIATLLAPAVSVQAVTATPGTASSTTTSSTATTTTRNQTFVDPLTGVNPGPSPKNRTSTRQSRIQPYSLLALPNSSGNGTGDGSSFVPETPPAGQPAKAPDAVIPAGISFINNPTAPIPQQNPDYSASSAQPVFDADGNVTGISINGQKQDYTAQIPYWCNEGVDEQGTHKDRTLNLCYRPTNLFSGQAQEASLGNRLSIIDGKPHIILDDINAQSNTHSFLATGILQKAMGDWNKLLGKNFFLLRSQLTQDKNDTTGKVVYDPSRDRLQYLFIKDDEDPNFDAAASTSGLRLNMASYNNGRQRMLTDGNTRESGSWGYMFTRSDGLRAGNWRDKVVTWGNGSWWTSDVQITHYATFEQAQNAFTEIRWRPTLVHELGHMLGLDHPEDSTKTTYTEGPGKCGCASDVAYYNNGPLLMQYNTDNVDEMFDGTLETSVQYRLIKDSISAALNYLKATKTANPSMSRTIRFTTVDKDGQATGEDSPLKDVHQSVGYESEYSDVRGADYCGGFDVIDYDSFTPASNMPAYTITTPKGYEISADNGTTWTTSTTIPTIPASSLPVLSQLKWDNTPTGRVWKSKDGKTLDANYGLSDLPDVQVLVRKTATEPAQPAKPDQPGGKDTPTTPDKPSKPSQSVTPAQPSKPVTPSHGSATGTAPSSKTKKAVKAAAAKKAAKKVSTLASTGVSLGAFAVLVVLTSAAGISLCITRRRKDPADVTSAR